MTINLNFKAIISTFLLSFSVALILFAVFPEGDLLLLAKLLAGALGVTLLSPFWYPHVRGVKKGDTVVIANPSPFIKLGSRYGVAQEAGRTGVDITVLCEDGQELKCEIVSYAGTFSKAKVRIKDDSQVVEVR